MASHSSTSGKMLASPARESHSAAFWNAVSSILVAGQPVLYLMILNRVTSVEISGIFTLANADANLFLSVGKFGMHNYQVSDQSGRWSDRQYGKSRVVTCLLMLVFGSVYILVSAWRNQYSFYKAGVIFWMCLFREVDAVEDYYHGTLQRHGRLDLGAKIQAVRIVLVSVILGILLVMTRDLLLSLAVSTAASLVFLLILVRGAYSRAGIRSDSDTRSVKDSGSIRKGPEKAGSEIGGIGRLLGSALPLFIGTFLAIYLSNAPRYAVDSLMSDQVQAVFGFILMPASVIELLNNFFVNPSIVEYSLLWEENQRKAFRHKLRRQVAVLAGITLLCLGLAWLCGTPILSVIYHYDLSACRKELLCCLVGGAFLGGADMLIVMLTIIRRQKSIVAGYAIACAVALFLPTLLVGRYGLDGACLSYLVLMAILCGSLFVMFEAAVKDRT